MATNTQTGLEQEISNTQRQGAVFGGGVHVALPEMAITFARGLVIQAWVRPTVGTETGTILHLGGGDAEIIFGLVDGAPILKVRGAGLKKSVAPFTAPAGAWTRIAVVLSGDGVTFYRGDEAFAGAGSVDSPLEVARDGNVIGASSTAAKALAAAIGEVRLWNRSDSADVILGSGGAELRGDEPGLVGWWTLEGADGAADRSPFGRDGALGGGAFKPCGSSFTVARPLERCLDFGQGQGVVDTQSFVLDKAVTWQAHVRVRDLNRKATLLDLQNRADPDRFVRVTAKKGVLTATVATATATTTMKTTALLKADTWTGVALRIGDDEKIALFVDGVPVADVTVESVAASGGTNILALPWRSRVQAHLGAGLDGQMAEVRLWSRALTVAEIGDTWKRRIHGWAPGLIACWRMDEGALQRPSTGKSAELFADGDFKGKTRALVPGRYESGKMGIGNDTLSSIRVPLGLAVTVFKDSGFTGASATYLSDTPLVGDDDSASSVLVEDRPCLLNIRGAGPRAWVHGALPAPREGLVLGSAPRVAPVRAAGLSKTALALPTVPAISAAGFTAQMWVNLDPSDGPAAPILTLSAAGSVADGLRGIVKDLVNASPVIRINALPANGGFDLGVTLRGAPQVLLVDGAIAARRWTHLTITLDGDGLLCVYSDGRLVRRDEMTALGAQDLTPAVGPVAGAVSELRVWSRALSRDEIEAGWQRRLSGDAGLVGRWALAGDLSGRPGSAEGAVIWREAPGLAIQSGPVVGRPTVKARASLLADQTGKGGKPQLCVDLWARDADGRSLPGCELAVIVGEAVPTYRGTVRPETKIATPKGFSITTDARGVARLAFPIAALSTPILKVRHAGMGEGEWALITPDQVIHEALASLTVNEVKKGRRAGSTTKPGKNGLCIDGAEDLVAILRGMLGVAATFSFEAESTGALAFGEADDEGAGGPPSPLSPPISGGEGYVMEIPADAPLVRRIGRSIAVNTPADDGGPVSFSALGDAWSATTNFVEGVVDVVGDVADAGLDLAEDAVNLGLATFESVGRATNAIIQSVTFAVNTTINGVAIAVSWTVETVEQVASAVLDLMAKIKKTTGEVLDYLAELFDWGDILETCDRMLSTLQGSIKTVKGGVQGLFTAMEGAIVGLEARALTALGGQAALPPSVVEARAQAADADPPASPGILDYLLSLLPDDLSQTIKDFQAVFDPITSVLESALGRLPGLVQGLGTEWNDPALQAAIADPRRLLDSDPADWLAIARLFVRLITNATVLALDLVGDLTVAILESFERLINLRLGIPYLTDFVEAHVLGGRPLTVGTMVCLITAIPTTVLYKEITGRKEGPAALANVGPQSFGTEEEEESFPWVDFVCRAFDIVASTYGGVLDSVSTYAKAPAEGAADPMKPWNWGAWILNGVNLGLGAAQLIANPFDEENRDAPGWVMFGFNVASWVSSLTSWIAALIELTTGNAAAKGVDVVAGPISDALGAVSGILNIVFTARDDDTSKSDVWVASLDLGATVGSLSAGIALPFAEKTEDPVSKGILAGIVIAGNVVSVGAKVVALVFVIVES